jgi:type II secretory pathway pseudopilin PulG
MSSNRKQRRGFTTLEMVISFVIMAMLLGSIGLATISGKDTYQQGERIANLEARARRALSRVSAELTAAQRTMLNPQPTAPLGGSNVRFRTCLGYSGGSAQWGPFSRVMLQQDPRDPNNGLDDDGDGLIDEGEVALVRDDGGPDEVTIVLVRGVSEYLQGETQNGVDDNANGLRDERGFSLVIDTDGTLTVRLTLAALDPKNQLLTRTFETEVHMRN